MKFYSFFLFFSVCLCLEAFDKDPLENATASLYAIHIPTGKVLVDENSQKSLLPSSCLKIVTTAAALHLLGPEMQFKTDLSYDGKIENGILKGNLYVVGGGDPCLGSDRSSSSLSWQKQLDTWALAVKQLGIEKIEGKIIGDASKWEKALAAPDWCWEDLGNYYGAGASSLSFHENAYSLVFKPGDFVGEKVSVLRRDPFLSHLILHSEVTTGPLGSGDLACVYGSEYSYEQYVRGTIPLGVSEFSIKGAIPNPSLACSSLLENCLVEKGISVENQIRLEGDKKVVHTTNSPKLSEIVYWTNQKSVNLYAEHLLKKMGEVSLGEGSTFAGIQAVKKFLEEKKIDMAGMHIADGSGLSRKNLITTKQLVSFLVEMRKSEFYPVFLESFPEVKKGIRAKSGSMSLAKGYVGYSGDIAFAILINQCLDSSRIKEKIDDFFYFISNETEILK